MELAERIIRQNPHWEGKKSDAVEGLKERDLLSDILEYDKDRQMLAILGLRRTGKTTMLQQYMRHLMEEGEDPKKILYFSFDEILGRDPEIIEKVLQVYEDEILRRGLKRTHIFFDEINHIPDWQIILKRYYDLNQKNKFILTGSSSIFLKKTKESLAGRIYEFELKPLEFREYLHLKDIKIENLTIQASTIKKELQSYLINGGFPEMVGEGNFDKIKRYANSIIEKIVYYDIPNVYDVREPGALREILAVISRKPGMIVEYRNLASTLNLTYQTVSKYVSYLEKAFLIKLIYNWRGSPVARSRKAKKAYLTTPSLAVGFMDSEREVYGILPELVENVVMTHLDAKYFYREYNEIDFIHEKIPIEVKYSETPEIKGSLNAAKKLKSKKLVVVTKHLEKREVKGNITVEYVPLWKFLLTTPSN